MSRQVLIVIVVLLSLGAAAVLYFLFFNNPKPVYKAGGVLLRKLSNNKALKKGYREPTNWGDIAQWIKNIGLDYNASVEQVLGFFKGINIEPTGWGVKSLQEEIIQYVNSGGLGRNDVKSGEFLS